VSPLRAACLTDWAGVLGHATEAARARNRYRLIGLPTLFLDVAITNEAELAFVASLAAAAPETLLTIPAADVATRGTFKIRDSVRLNAGSAKPKSRLLESSP